jgi:hypothetical protein
MCSISSADRVSANTVSDSLNCVNISAHRDTVTLHPSTAALGRPYEPVGPFGQALVSPTHWMYPHAIAPPAKAKGGAVHC